jgi:hypothetical protein
MSWFPAAFRPPAFASRSSDSRRGIGRPLRSAYRASCPDHDGVTTFRTHELRPGRVAPIPRGPGGAHPAGHRSPAGTRRRFQRPVPTTPLPPPTYTGLLLTRHQRSFKQFTRPVFSLPAAPGWDGRPWAFPRASNPAITGDARQGRRQAAEHGPGTMRSTSADPPIRIVLSSRATSCRTRRYGRAGVGALVRPLGYLDCAPEQSRTRTGSQGQAGMVREDAYYGPPANLLSAALDAMIVASPGQSRARADLEARAVSRATVAASHTGAGPSRVGPCTEAAASARSPYACAEISEWGREVGCCVPNPRRLVSIGSRWTAS